MSSSEENIVKMLRLLTECTSLEQWFSRLGDLLQLAPTPEHQAMHAKMIREAKSTARRLMDGGYTEEEAVKMMTNYLYGPQINPPTDAETQAGSRAAGTPSTRPRPSRRP